MVPGSLLACFAGDVFCRFDYILYLYLYFAAHGTQPRALTTARDCLRQLIVCIAPRTVFYPFALIRHSFRKLPHTCQSVLRAAYSRPTRARVCVRAAGAQWRARYLERLHVAGGAPGGSGGSTHGSGGRPSGVAAGAPPTPPPRASPTIAAGVIEGVDALAYTPLVPALTSPVTDAGSGGAAAAARPRLSGGGFGSAASSGRGAALTRGPASRPIRIGAPAGGGGETHGSAGVPLVSPVTPVGATKRRSTVSGAGGDSGALRRSLGGGGSGGGGGGRSGGGEGSGRAKGAAAAAARARDDEWMGALAGGCAARFPCCVGCMLVCD